MHTKKGGTPGQMGSRLKEGSMRRLLKDLVEYLPSFVVQGLVGLIAVPVITRLFPADIYGKYAVVMASVAVASSLMSWVSVSIVRFFPRCEQESTLRSLYATTIVTLLATTAIIALGYVLALRAAQAHIEEELCSLMRIGGLLLIAIPMFNVLKEFLRAKRIVRWYTGLTVWQSVGGLGIGLALVLLGRVGIQGLLWGRMISVLLALPALWMMAVGRVQFRAELISARLIWSMAKYGFPLAAGNLAAWVLSLSDRYLLEAFRGSNEVGIYSASYGVAEKSLMLVVALFSAASSPAAMHVWEKEGERASQRFSTQSTRYYLIAVLPMVIGLSVLAKPLIRTLMAPGYHEGFRVMPMVALSAFLLGLTQRFGIGFCYRNVTHYVTLALVVSGLLNVGLNLLLVPAYGYMAAAWTTLVSYGTYLMLQVLFSRRFFTWEFPMGTLIRTSLGASFMGAVIYPVGNGLTASQFVNVLVAIPVGVAVYFVALTLLGELQPNEKKALKELAVRYLPGWVVPISWRKGP